MKLANPVELYFGTTRLFRFNPTPQTITIDISKVGNSPMDIPGFIRPYMFDFTSQSRVINIRATLLNLSAYDGAYPGTGSILDQIEDLMYIMSGNWCTSGEGYLQLYVPYPSALDAAHSLTTMYPSTSNSDYLLDQGSIPSGESPVGSGVTRALADKVYYVYPQQMNIERDEASVNRVRVALQFVEAGYVVKI